MELRRGRYIIARDTMLSDKGWAMANKKPRSVIGLIGEAMSDVVDAASVAATGSQLGVLELAAEAEMRPTPATRKRKAKKRKAKAKTKTKTKAAGKKSKKMTKKATKPKQAKKAKKKRGAKRARR